MTAEQLAQAYVQAIYSAPNAWGQCVHATQGRSDHIMFRLFKLVGETEGRRLIDAAMKVHKHDR